MNEIKSIKTALISVFDKDRIAEIAKKLVESDVTILSTGGTFDYLKGLSIPDMDLRTVEELTSYPSILSGRVKTLHPKIFGGILARREDVCDRQQLDKYDIPEIDLVIVDLYPFENTAATTDDEAEIIEKIDIGGISLIRAAAKNFNDVVIIASKDQYAPLLDILNEKGAETTLEERKWFAKEAFAVSSGYDTAIFNYFDDGEGSYFRYAQNHSKHLRYGENPHQQALFYGNFENEFEQIQGKEISYNNLLDIEAAVSLIRDFSKPTFAILKHNNACGVASRSTLIEAWKDALAGDPISAYGGIIVTNWVIDKATAEEIHQLFFEIIIAPDYDLDALEILSQKKNRIILIRNQKYERARFFTEKRQFRSVLNGVLVQDKDLIVETRENLRTVTQRDPDVDKIDDLLFANKLVKHTKSNAIVLAKGEQLFASGTGQTSRVDALKQAIAKAQSFGFDLNGAVMASDAFFPFPDCIEIASSAGIKNVIQPGGSIHDKEVVAYCDKHDIAMVFTGIRHFKH
ncbi:MAG: bifunctional phosphoribosylaminoimidazolecarboxamide formyltransferase/IMP cyclohydrolase [Bacteroidales bacterium]|jgi:phosphoribosylaminoimidazolecarboxamide formyltransferase/IMP cyclohydrolase|nr:bifunctional phosphoribosylaminoimidazolecarboxamide formyltransferase/IMP cyclohydrolase [Bacteroidales bacterium]